MKLRPWHYLTLTILIVLAIFTFLSIKTKYEETQKDSYVISCSAYNRNHELLISHPGALCDYLPDGRVLMSNDKSLFLLDQRDTPLWKFDEYVHHALNAVDEGRNIVYFTDEDQMFKDDLTRFDIIKKVDLKTGNLLAQWKLSEHLDQITPHLPWKYVKSEHLLDLKMGGHPHTQAKYELLHFNSIYQIPKNASHPKLFYMKPGNFIVSAGISLILFFDNNLNLIHTLVYDEIAYTTFHDVQALPSGQLLVYHNSGARFWCSRLEMVDSEDLKLTWSFKDETLEFLCSSRFGGVQLLKNGNLLFSDVSKGGRVIEINPEGHLLVDFYHPEKDPITKLPIDIYKVKSQDLSSFFRNRQN